MKRNTTLKHHRKTLEEDEEIKRKRQLMENMNNKKFLLKQEFEYLQERERCEGIKEETKHEIMVHNIKKQCTGFILIDVFLLNFRLYFIAKYFDPNEI